MRASQRVLRAPSLRTRLDVKFKSSRQYASTASFGSGSTAPNALLPNDLNRLSSNDSQASSCTPDLERTSSNRSSSSSSSSGSSSFKEDGIAAGIQAERGAASGSSILAAGAGGISNLEPLPPYITKDSWNSVKDRLLSAIRESEFVAFDLELSGLHRTDERFVGVDRCYHAHAHGAKHFMPVQIGLCMAKMGKDSQWSLTPASIYIFPSEDKNALFSTATIKFLGENGFSFDTWMSKGMGWIQPEVEDAKIQAVKQRIDEIKELKRNVEKVKRGNSQSSSSIANANGTKDVATQTPPMTIPDGPDKEIVEEVSAKIRDWLDTSEENSLEIPMENAFQRLLLHTVIGQEFPNLHSLSQRRPEGRYLCVYKSQGDVYDEQLHALEEEIEAIKAQAGVRLLLDEISKHSKLLVGHNCFFDICHLHESFYGKLPVGEDFIKNSSSASSDTTSNTSVSSDPGSNVSDTSFTPVTSESLTPVSASKGAAPYDPIGASSGIQAVSAFKKAWTTRFPKTIDTKYLAENHSDLSQLSPPSSLKDLCDFMVSSCTAEKDKLRFSLEADYDFPMHFQKYIVESESGVRNSNQGVINGKPITMSSITESYESLSKFSHDAGYDAAMTAITFLFQTFHVLEKKALNWNHLTTTSSTTLLLNATTSTTSGSGSNINLQGKCSNLTDLLFSTSVNKIKLVKTTPNLIDLNLNHQKYGSESEEYKSLIGRHFYMYNYPLNWKRWDISRIWSPVHVSVNLVDQNSAWIIVNSEEDAENIKLIYGILEGNKKMTNFKLATYDEFRKGKLEKNTSNNVSDTSNNGGTTTKGGNFNSNHGSHGNQAAKM